MVLNGGGTMMLRHSELHLGGMGATSKFWVISTFCGYTVFPLQYWPLGARRSPAGFHDIN